MSILALCVIQFIAYAFAIEYKDLLDVCIGKNGKRFPVIERTNTTGICKAWYHKSCCFDTTAPKVKSEFNYDHCEKKMSERCKEYFYKRSCFESCSPNLGPWLRNENGTLRKPSKYVPLCREECDEWWNACKSELTCVENWSSDFVWKDSKNTCPEKAKCRTFQDVYKDSTYFCEHVYGPFDFAVVSDNTHCMMIFERISDNNFVAAHYAQELVEHSQDGAYQFLSNYTESKEEYCESTLENSSHFKMAHLVLSFVLGAVVTTIVMIGAYCVKRYKNKKVPYTLQSEDDG